jgi:rhamnogalacturonyl hydrolase YesR
MLPPFLAIMGEFGEAQKQLDGYLDCLNDLAVNRLGTGLLYHIYDAEKNKYVRQKLWATGNGWALLGISRFISHINKSHTMSPVVLLKYIQKSKKLLDAMLEHQCESGLFHDILDDNSSFEDGTAAMMVATFIYRGIAEDWLEHKYNDNADKVYTTMQSKIDEFGIIRGVCGAPHFKTPGTSAEAQAAYIMMQVWRNKAEDKVSAKG